MGKKPLVKLVEELYGSTSGNASFYIVIELSSTTVHVWNKPQESYAEC